MLLRVLAMVALVYGASAQCPSVTVEEGVLGGQLINRAAVDGNASLCVYWAVPYALPPVGELRFKDPVKPDAWNGTRNATEPPPPCLQRNQLSRAVTGSEDCLYLNIFVHPDVVSSAFDSAEAEVMVFLHGGDFAVEDGNMLANRPDELVEKRVVFVGLNFRLGPLGFLNTGDSEAPGNAGLKDQREALRWLQRNIATFGGDPGKVTLLGTSSGAVMVQQQMLSSSNRGLFQRAWSISGSSPNGWGLVEEPRRYARQLRDHFNASCADFEPDAIVPCLQAVNASDIVLSYFDLPALPGEEWRFYILQNKFIPSLEAANSSADPLLLEDPLEVLERGDALDIPYVTGSTSGDGIVIVFLGGLVTASRLREADAHLAQILKWDLPGRLRGNEAAAAQLRAFYLGNASVAGALQDDGAYNALARLITDVYFATGAWYSGRLLAASGLRTSPVFVYNFTDEALPFTKQMLNLTQLDGVCHDDDLPFLLTPAGAAVASDVQARRRRLQEIYTAFAQSGNPTPPDSNATAWLPFDNANKYFLEIGEKLVLRSGPDARTAFWESLLPIPGE